MPTKKPVVPKSSKAAKAAKVKPAVKAKTVPAAKQVKKSAAASSKKPMTKPGKKAAAKPVKKAATTTTKSAAKSSKPVKTAKTPKTIKKPKAKAAPAKAAKAKTAAAPAKAAKPAKPSAGAGTTSSKKKLTTVSKPKMTKQIEIKKKAKPAAPAKAKPSAVKPSASGVLPYQEIPGEEYMNAEQRQHFRQILLHWKQQLMEEVDRTVHHMQDEAANFPDPNDRATQEEEFSLELRTRDRERKLIKKIDEALQKIENNDYGFCDACGIEIGIRRLEARPTATLCIDCKTIDEIKERQMGGHF